MGRPSKTNWKDTAPPPSYDDLKFQSDSWYARYPANSSQHGPHLSPESYRNLFADNTLSWSLHREISGAAKILLAEDDDSL